MKNLTVLIALLCLSLVLGACASPEDATAPPEILYGQDVCEECHMIIGEARYAAAYKTLDGLSRRFDDIGNMLLFHHKNQEEVGTFWVHDYYTEEWLAAPDAFFVLSDDLHTPMGHGIVACLDQSAAEELAADVHGEVMDFNALLAKTAADIPTHDHDNEHDPNS